MPYSFLVCGACSYSSARNEELPRSVPVHISRATRAKRSHVTSAIPSPGSAEGSAATITDRGPRLSAQLAAYATHDGEAKSLSLLGHPTFYEAN